MRRGCAFIVVLAACKVGTPIDNEGTGGDGGTDASVDTFDQTACVDPLPPAEITPAHEHSEAAGLGTKAGESCAAAGDCHGVGALNNNPWLFSGTVYASDGVTPQPGVLVRVRTSDPQRPLRAVTDTAGNFHFLNNPASATQMLLTFPTRVEVTACPDVTQMNRDVVDEADLNCTNGMCHLAGQRIRLTLP